MATNIAINIKGLTSFRAALLSFPSIAAPRIDSAIKKSIYNIQRQTVPITPVDTGHLRRSIGEGIRFSPLTGRIGSNLNYATIQHERTDFRHPRGGQAKYLEEGVRRSINTIEKEFRIEINNTFEEIARRAKR